MDEKEEKTRKERKEKIGEGKTMPLRERMQGSRGGGSGRGR